MKKLRIFADWQSKFPKVMRNFELVNDNSYEYAVVMNTPKPNINLPKEKVIGFAVEPYMARNFNQFASYAEQNIGCYLVGDSTGLPAPFVSYHAFMCTPAKHRMVDSPVKTHPMCMVVSSKKMFPGHKKRHALAKKVVDSGLDIHLWGSGASQYGKGGNIKGGFKDHKDVFPHYYFDITVENCRWGRYVSEKFNHPIINECCPLYLGSPHVREMYNDCFFDLYDDLDKSMEFITEIYNNYQKYYDTKKEQLKITKQNLIQTHFLDVAEKYFEDGEFSKIIL